MVDDTGKFNEKLTLPDAGFIRIGPRSDYSVRYRLTGVDLYLLSVDQTSRSLVQLFGTWAKETTKPQQKLGLRSSERFFHDGSSTETFVETMDLDYCEPTINTRECVSLAGLEEGYGELPDGTLYHLAADGTLTLFPSDKPERIEVKISGPDPRSLYVSQDRTDPSKYVVPSGTLGASESFGEACYEPGHGPEQWRTTAKQGGTVHVQEEWDVPADAKLLIPGRVYELEVKTQVDLKHKGTTKSGYLSETATIRFRAGDPPLRSAELTNYVQRVYPSNGMRPVFTDYDLLARFHEDYIKYLYEASLRELRFRLFDGQGNPLKDSAGNDVLLPATTLAQGKRSRTEERWVDIYDENVTRGCIAGPPIPNPKDTESSILGPLLTPNSQYRAELVAFTPSSSALAPGLFSWSFTTSRFKTFTDLVTQNRTFRAAVVASNPIASAQAFEPLMTALGLPVIHYVDWFTVTPIHKSDGSGLVACLLESPEPLGFDGRLTVQALQPFLTAAGVPVTNIDGTRALVFFNEPGGMRLNPDVRLTWKREVQPPKEHLPKLSLGGVSSDEVVTFSIPVG